MNTNSNPTMNTNNPTMNTNNNPTGTTGSGLGNNMNANSNPTTSSGTTGSGFGNKIKGAVEVVHGAGENLRGTVLGAVDTMGKKGPTKNDVIAREGRLEMERGLANLRGSKAASQAGAGPTGGAMGTAPQHPQQYANTDTTQAQNNQFKSGNAPYGGGPTSTGGTMATAPQQPQQYGNTDTTQAQNNQFKSGNAPYGGPTSMAAAPGSDVGYMGNSNQPQRNDAGGSEGAYGPQPTFPGHHRDDALSGVPPDQLREVQAVNHDNQLSQDPRSDYDPAQANYRGQSNVKEPMRVAPSDQRTDGLPSSGYNTTGNDKPLPPNVGPMN